MTRLLDFLSGAVRSWPILVLIAAAGLTGCDDPYGPQSWRALPDTITLYTADRVEDQGRPAAYDFRNHRPVVIETPGEAANWDFAFMVGDDEPQLVPPSALGGMRSVASIAVEDAPYDAVERAPSDTARYSRTEPVELDLENVYIIRTRRYFDLFGRSCSSYAKIQPIVVDSERGRFQFTYVYNPNCNDRSLVPTDDD